MQSRRGGTSGEGLIMEQAVTTSRTGRFISWQILSTWQEILPGEALGAGFPLPPCGIGDLEASPVLPRFGVSAFRAASV
ncbi:MAG: hypothetical protein KF735_02395 [Chelatococcus sp.]|uniref:hypothetical protein n=1 Tax=Chelatococcus sp. TaxID=1953771 RepID=UPI0025BAFA8A|nr:hypothetical protein [Chelatococcus sp.]MBX3536463.1 hypothetical protein [Chelatococcus sp.]